MSHNQNKTMQIQIEKNVPLPSYGTGGGIWVTTLNSMNPGDSFQTDYEKCTAIRAAAKKMKLKITARTQADKSKSRVWLVAKSA